MNFKVNIPFTELEFKNATSKQKKFFNSLFFELGYKTEPVLKITVIFSNPKKGRKGTVVEDEVFADENNFYLGDTKRNLTRINFYDFKESEITIEADESFDLYYLYNFIIEPLIIIWSVDKKIAYLHSSGLSSESGKSALFTAWRTTGKTNTVLSLAQKGFYFLGDDYCLVEDGNVYIYPKNINLFSYNLKVFPRIYNKLPFSTSLRLKFVQKFKDFLFQMSQSISGPLSKIFFRISELAEVSTNIKISPEKLGIEILPKSLLNRVFLLQKTEASKTEIIKISKEEAIEKICKIMIYELNDFFNIYNKYAFIFPKKKVRKIEEFEDKYRNLISSMWSDFYLVNLGEDLEDSKVKINSHLSK